MQFSIEFSKVTYEKGAPKNLPRWTWRCACGCGAMNGPFRTLREAEADAEAAVLCATELTDAHNERRKAINH
jgi:hypothetical protein